MVLYEFICAGCGPFDAWRPVTSPAATCPSCGRDARRRYTAPGLARLAAPMRAARDREERSAYAPELTSHPTGRPLPAHHHH